MQIEDLTQIQLFFGIFGLIYSAVGIIIGLIIASKFAEHKRKELLFIGLSLSAVTLPYLAPGISLLTILFFKHVLDDTSYIFLSFGFAGFALISWIYGIGLLIFSYLRKKITLIFIVIGISYEIFVIVAMFLNPSLVATREDAFDITSGLIVRLFNIFSILVILFTIIVFVRECLKSENLNTKWRGRFLLVSAIFLAISVILIAINPTDITLEIISRILLFVRLFLSYLGWLMPARVAKFLIKDQKQ